MNEGVVNHKNMDRADNRLENLEFCTQRENLLHGARITEGNVGERHGSNKYSTQQILLAKERLAEKVRPSLIVKETGVSRDIVYLLSKNRVWKSLEKFLGNSSQIAQRPE